MPENKELIIRFHPVGGEDVTIATADFDDATQALEAITRALDHQHSLTLTQARYNRETDTNAVVINLANVVSVRVSSKDSAATGQYL
ncbi:hypothetical protein [Actinomadura sp. HBU206391]|uniref:hypothetical protein n=1 Tax=Actinomadura sp. HBU206391 TaxID=2731692 RepID=UPI0016502626|nr:hypothetical protein [Actinomadura sp. HBU206391]MBC6458630.1 hypothetical protein [Actinomadura sp. HBU206391]